LKGEANQFINIFGKKYGDMGFFIITQLLLEIVYDDVKPLKKPENFKKLKHIAIKEHVKKITEEMKK